MNWFKQAWSVGIPIADEYERNNHQEEPTIPTMRRRNTYEDIVAGDIERKPATGEGEYPKNISRQDWTKDERTAPFSGENELSPGTSILEDGFAPSEHYHGNKFIDPVDQPKMTDEDLPKTINGRLRNRVPLIFR
jgi:hypothetical protein